MCSAEAPCGAGQCVEASRIVLFGGQLEIGGSTYLGDTWEWDGTTWTQRSATGPMARAFHAMATLSGKVVLFGGASTDGPNDDTWEWDGIGWTERKVVGPSARSWHAMATLSDKIVLFGGLIAGSPSSPISGVQADTWEWDGNSWTQRMVTGPPGRWGATMAPAGNKLVLYGGTESYGGSYAYDAWAWDGNTWTSLPSPSDLVMYAAMAPLGSEVVLFGSADLVSGGTWTSDGMSWMRRAPGGPSPRASEGMATLRGRVLLFGGNGANYQIGPFGASLSDTWEWDGNAWTQRSVNVSGPSARTGLAMTAR
jgi:N-acetylneuraminic acid mutarotase